MTSLGNAYQGSNLVDNNEVAMNRSQESFLTLDGVTGPVKEIVPGSFAVKKFFVYAFRDVQVGRTGLLQPGGVNNISHLSVVIPTPNMLPALQQDCFSGRLFKTATIKNFGNINSNNKEILEVKLTDARLALVTANFDPNGVGASLDSHDVFGGTTDFDQNRHLMMMATQRFPNPSKVYQVLLKLAFETITVTATHHHDGGDDSGKSATTIDLNKNTAQATG